MAPASLLAYCFRKSGIDMYISRDHLPLRVPTSGPRISVLLPVFNAEPYLAGSLDSILSQTFENFEIVAIDDGSTDASAKILSDYAGRDARIRIVKQAHLGIAATLNNGLHRTRGEYVARMDADDISTPTRFAQQISFLEQHRDIAAVGCAISIIDVDGNVIGYKKYPQDRERISDCIDNGIVAFAHPAMMFRRSALLIVGGYRCAYEYAEDYDLWTRMVERFTMSNLPDRLLLLRRHPDSITSRHRVRHIFVDKIARATAKIRQGGQFDPTENADILSPKDLQLVLECPQALAALKCELAEYLIRVDQFYREENLDLAFQLSDMMIPGVVEASSENPLAVASALMTQVKGALPSQVMRVLMLLAWRRARQGRLKQLLYLLFAASTHPKGISSAIGAGLGRIRRRMLQGMIG